jgi:curli production assembly/transport component CsgF
MTRSTQLVVVALFASFLFVGSASAQQLLYEPVNPAFGGNYLNYQWMLSSAQAQKKYTDPARSQLGRDPFDDFTSSLQRQILSALSRELIYNRFRDLDLTREGRYELGDYTVNITPGLDGISIKIFNLLTGAESTVTIPNY